MAVDQKAMSVLKLYLRDYPIENRKWLFFDKWGVQQQPWSAREGKRGWVYRFDPDGSGLVRVIIVNYFDPPPPLKPGQKQKRTALDEEDDKERPAARVFLPYLNVATWHPEAQDAVNHYVGETFHFFHPEGTGRFISGYRRAGVSHWTEEEAPLNSSHEGLDADVLARLKGLVDEKVKAAIAEVHAGAPAAGDEELEAGLRNLFESTVHIKPYWKTLEIYEIPGPFNPAKFSAE